MESPPNIKQVRCAIYTRKSTTDGAEQDFTSLDAQRESALSYIQSQKSLGWIALPEIYDDYGFTGANMNRPALERLIADINAGKIDCALVYKVDRLSRSLLDFTKLLELFDGKGVAFVSVTQHFNTNNSMGRLTLHILLSFAQFEREIISERTRDKMAAAKKKGKFIGGLPPMGYNLDKENHKIVINAEEAKIVLELFTLYVQEQSLLRVATIVNEKGYRTKARIRKGLPAGTKKFSTTGIQLILRNVLYSGRVRCNKETYPGMHEAIIPDELFDSVQQILTENRDKRPIKAGRESSLGILSKLFRCKTCGTAMIRSYTKKRNKYKYSYYICCNAIKRGYENCPTKVINAQRVENVVVDYLRSLVDNPYLAPKVWEKLPLTEQMKIIQSSIKTVDYDGHQKILGITLLPDFTRREFSIDLKAVPQKVANPEELIKQEPPIRRLLLLAHHIQRLLDKGRAKNLKEVASWLNTTHARLNQINNLLFLSPAIQEEILCSDSRFLFDISERALRPILQEASWEKQISSWQCLLKSLNERPSPSSINR